MFTEEVRREALKRALGQINTEGLKRIAAVKGDFLLNGGIVLDTEENG